MEMANEPKKMKQRLFLLLLVACSALSLHAAEKKTVVASVLRLPEQEVAYNDGIELLRASNYEDAATKFSAAIAIDSTFAKAYYNRAVANFNTEKYTKAMSDVNSAIRLLGEKESTDCHILKCKIYYAVGNIASAIEEIETALANDNSNYNALMDKAALLQATGKYEEAIETFNQAVTRDSGNTLILNELGNCYTKLGNGERAFEYFKKGYEADSTNAVVKYNYAISLWRIKSDTIKSLRLIDSLIETNLTNAKYYTAKGYILNQAGRDEEASEQFRIALTQDKSYAPAHLGLGIALYNLERVEEAVDEFTNAIEDNTNYGDAYLNRAIAKESLGKFDEACEDMAHAAKLGAKKAEEYYNKQCK